MALLWRTPHPSFYSPGQGLISLMYPVTIVDRLQHDTAMERLDRRMGPGRAHGHRRVAGGRGAACSDRVGNSLKVR